MRITSGVAFGFLTCVLQCVVVACHLYRSGLLPRSGAAKPWMAIRSRSGMSGNGGGPAMDGGLATLYRDVFLTERCLGGGGGAGGGFFARGSPWGDG